MSGNVRPNRISHCTRCLSHVPVREAAQMQSKDDWFSTPRQNIGNSHAVGEPADEDEMCERSIDSSSVTAYDTTFDATPTCAKSPQTPTGDEASPVEVASDGAGAELMPNSMLSTHIDDGGAEGDADHLVSDGIVTMRHDQSTNQEPSLVATTEEEGFPASLALLPHPPQNPALDLIAESSCGVSFFDMFELCPLDSCAPLAAFKCSIPTDSGSEDRYGN